MKKEEIVINPWQLKVNHTPEAAGQVSKKLNLTEERTDELVGALQRTLELNNEDMMDDIAEASKEAKSMEELVYIVWTAAANYGKQSAFHGFGL